MEANVNTTTRAGPVEPRRIRQSGLITRSAASIAMAVGVLVLIGWFTGIRPLTSILHGYATIKANTAFCFLLAGSSLWLLRRPPEQAGGTSPACGSLGQICGLLVAGIGLLTLAEYSLRLNLGIDEALIRDTWTDIRVSPPGRVSMATGFGFFMLGSSLVFLGRKRRDKQSPTIFHLESEIIARSRELTEELGKPVQGFDVFVEKARSGQDDEREWTYVRKDGKTLTVNLVPTASYDTNGTIVGFLGVAMDVTARHSREGMKGNRRTT